MNKGMKTAFRHERHHPITPHHKPAKRLPLSHSTGND
jgi:hypothetical protein